MAGTVKSSLSGEILDGRYELLESIGAGGVGEVYRARLLKLDRLVAVKVLHETLVANADFVERCQREAKAISRMHHPHCVALLDFGVFQSRPYLVLEYLPGHTVTRLLQDGPFAPPRAVGIALQLLDALSYFHGQFVIHRDLKSENLMLVGPGATRDFLKVLDFGMAKILDSDAAASQLSQRGLVPGTVSAMAPEQLQQLRPDRRIDIYGTGILLYEMIVGHRPFRGTDPAVVARMQLDTRPRRPREVMGAGALSSELERVILRALEKDRADRFDGAEQMAEALQRTPEGRASAPRPGSRTPQPPPPIPVSDPASPPRPPPPPTVHALRATTPPGLPVPRPRPAGRRRLVRAGVIAAAGVALLAWVGRSSLHGRATRLPAAAAPPPSSPPPPPPTASAGTPAPTPPGAVAWSAHRDLAVVYVSRGDQNEAFRAVKAALDEDPVAAGADPALLDAAVAVLSPNRVPLVLDAFRSNPGLVEALAAATAGGTTRMQRHAALAALESLGTEAGADLVAMRLLDLEQATTCDEMRTAFNKLAAADDPRIKRMTDDLRARGPGDRHARCLRAALHPRGGPRI